MSIKFFTENLFSFEATESLSSSLGPPLASTLHKKISETSYSYRRMRSFAKASLHIFTGTLRQSIITADAITIIAQRLYNIHPKDILPPGNEMCLHQGAS